jgi:hypothetical protein
MVLYDINPGDIILSGDIRQFCGRGRSAAAEQAYDKKQDDRAHDGDEQAG